jgi:hypothetical protein
VGRPQQATQTLYLAFQRLDLCQMGALQVVKALLGFGPLSHEHAVFWIGGDAW